MGWFGKKKNYEEEWDDEDDYEEEEEENEANVVVEGNLELKVLSPKTMEQLLVAVDYLSNGITVLLNLEGVDKALCRRMIDFISGAAYALEANIKKATQDSFFVAPMDVDVSGDIFESNSSNSRGSDNETFSDL